jgi:hypothetical protein
MPNRPWPLCTALPATLPIFLLAIFALIGPKQIRAQTSPRANPIRRAVIIDTDAGADDLMAIAFLLARSDIQVEAITIENGMAHVPAGGKNVLRLLALAGRTDVPVFLGREMPLSGVQEFPEEWRRASDDLPGIDLPEATRSADSRSAEDYLLRRSPSYTSPRAGAAYKFGRSFFALAASRTHGTPTRHPWRSHRRIGKFGRGRIL